jgi:hypothetical protein
VFFVEIFERVLPEFYQVIIHPGFFDFFYPGLGLGSGGRPLPVDKLQ